MTHPDELEAVLAAWQDAWFTKNASTIDATSMAYSVRVFGCHDMTKEHVVSIVRAQKLRPAQGWGSHPVVKSHQMRANLWPVEIAGGCHQSTRHEQCGLDHLEPS